MRHSKFVCGILSLTFLTGCLQTHLGITKARELVSIQKDCGEISKVGHLQSIRNFIRLDVEKVLELTAKENVPHYLSEIEKRSERIHKNVELLKSLLHRSWTEERWTIENIWTVPYVNASQEKPSEVSIEKIISNGLERNDLRSKIKWFYTLQGIRIVLPRDTSSLEHCELSRTFGIYLKLTYGSIIKTSTHHRLILEEGNL